MLAIEAEKKAGAETKKFSFEQMRESDEKADAPAYAFEILGEGCDELKANANEYWRYCPILQAWRSLGGVAPKENSITGWRYAVFLKFQGKTVHSSGFIYNNFADAAKNVPGASSVVAWCEEVEGNPMVAAPFLDKNSQREFDEPLYG